MENTPSNNKNGVRVWDVQCSALEKEAGDGVMQQPVAQGSPEPTPAGPAPSPGACTGVEVPGLEPQDWLCPPLGA